MAANTQELQRYTTDLQQEYLAVETDMINTLKQQKEVIESQQETITGLDEKIVELKKERDMAE